MCPITTITTTCTPNNQNKSVPFSKMSKKQQSGKLTEITRQEAEDKRIVLLMKYNMQNGFLNWGKLEMEMECDDLSWKKSAYSIFR